MPRTAPSSAVPFPCLVAIMVLDRLAIVAATHEKRRFEFGLIRLVITLCTMSLGFLLWLVMPCYRETIGVDRYAVCTTYGARQR
jgi:hypothetical protein